MKDIMSMVVRIKSMRKALVEELAKAGSKKDWSFIERQIGMFAFTVNLAQPIQYFRV